MRSTIAILSLVASVVAEAPYNLPRPSTPFNYPSAQQHHHHHHAPPPPPPVRYQQPQQIYQPQQLQAQNGGYQYQLPSIQPTYVQPAPQSQYQIPQAPLPIQIQPQPLYQQPAPIQFQPQPQPIYQPAPQPISQHIYEPAPRPIPQPQPQFFQPPSTSYGTPQFRPQPLPQPQPQPQPIQIQPQPIQIQPQPIPTYIAPQPRPQVQPQQVYQPVQQFSQQQGYNYQQPQIQFSVQPQYTQLQSQPLTRNPVTTSLSSYQADSNQYSGSRAQGEALDSVVVNQVENIIKESEHTSARDNGYLSLVSGVSLENAQPSIEISSFTHTSPLNIGSSQREFSSLVSAPSADYGQPSFTSVGSELSSSSGSASLSFLPQTKPPTAYGVPDKK